MGRKPMFVPQCMINGCPLARGHIGTRHGSTPFGRALANAPTMFTRWGGPGGAQGFHLVEFVTPNGRVSGPDVTAQFIKMFDPGKPALR